MEIQGETMSYYTEYRTIMDEFAWKRLVEYWKKTKEDVDMGIYPSDQMYTRNDTYLVKDELNHGPRMDEVCDWIYSTLGISSSHYKIYVREENWDYWDKDGKLGTDYNPDAENDTDGWTEIDVDTSSDNLPSESEAPYMERIIELLEELNDKLDTLIDQRND